GLTRRHAPVQGSATRETGGRKAPSTGANSPCPGKSRYHLALPAYLPSGAFRDACQCLRRRPCRLFDYRFVFLMLPGQQQQLISLIQAAVASIVPEAQPNILLERPKLAANGDIATNVAMQLAKPARRNPRELAQQIVDALLRVPGVAALVSSADIA